MVSVLVVLLNELADRLLKFPGENVVPQLDHVLYRSVIGLDLVDGVIRCSTIVLRLVRRSVLLGFDFITIVYTPYPVSIVCRCLVLSGVDSCLSL